MRLFTRYLDARAAVREIITDLHQEGFLGSPGEIYAEVCDRLGKKLGADWVAILELLIPFILNLIERFFPNQS